MNTVKIDHTSHPFIIDTILSYCDPAALLAFCSTSHQYRRKLAAWLDHSSFYREEDKKHRLTSRARCSPGALPFVPALVTVLDLNDECWSRRATLFTWKDTTAPAFTSLHIIRRLGFAVVLVEEDEDMPAVPGRGLPPAATTVYYINLDWASLAHSTPVLVVEAPIRQLIVHLRWCDDEPFDRDSQRALCAEEIFNLVEAREDLEVVFIIWPFTTSGDQPGYTSAAALISNLLNDLGMWVTN